MTTHATNFTGTILIKGEEYQFDLPEFQAKDSAGSAVVRKLQLLVDRVMKHHPDLNPDLIESISCSGLRLSDGRVLDVDDVWTPFLSDVRHDARPTLLPNRFEADIPEPDLVVDDLAHVRFEFLDEFHPLDTIPYPRCDYPPMNDEELVIAEGTRLAGKPFKIEQEPHSRIGIFMETAPRKNYRMSIQLKGKMKEFFGRENLTSTEVLGKNSPVAEGAITSSYNRKADTVSMMRKVESDDLSSDFYTGRADTLPKIRELVEFTFLGEWELYNLPENRHLAKGITYNSETGQYEFRFATQSLLTLFGGERKKLMKEVKAYEEIAKQPMMIDGKIVKIIPLPIAATNFNWVNTLGEAIPGAALGQNLGEEMSAKALYELVGTVRSLSSEDEKLLRDLVDHCENRALKPWQRLLSFALLCEMLKIPLVIHCKSCVDRTNVLAAMITALRQWRSCGIAIPKDGNGLYAPHEMANVSLQDGTHPFKELFAYSLLKGLKITELSRAQKGYKLKRGWGQHKGLHDLLPARYLESVKPSKQIFRRTAVAILYLFFFWLFFLISPFLNKKLHGKWFEKSTLALAVAPASFARYGDKLATSIRVNESYEEAGGRSLLYSKRFKNFR